MIFIVSLLLLFFLRFLFGMMRGLLLIFVIGWLLVDESRIHPQFGKAFWETVTAAAEKVADFGRDQQFREATFGDRDPTYQDGPWRRAAPPHEELGTGYR
jgi:hypothetical protein